MIAISLWQPWASALFAPRPSGQPIKRYETRHWEFPRRYRGKRVAIHAAKRKTREELEFWQDTVIETIHRPLYGEAFGAIGITCFKDLPLGCIIGEVVFDFSVRTETVRESIDCIELDWGNYADGRWAWPTIERKAYPVPMPCIGRQGFFFWDNPHRDQHHEAEE